MHRLTTYGWLDGSEGSRTYPSNERWTSWPGGLPRVWTRGALVRRQFCPRAGLQPIRKDAMKMRLKSLSAVVAPRSVLTARATSEPSRRSGV